MIVCSEMVVRKCVLIVISFFIAVREVNPYKIVLVRTASTGNKNIPFQVYNDRNFPRIIFPSTDIKRPNSKQVSVVANLSIIDKNNLNSGQKENTGRETSVLLKNKNIFKREHRGFIGNDIFNFSKNKHSLNRIQKEIRGADRANLSENKNISNNENNEDTDPGTGKSLLRTDSKKMDSNPTVIGRKTPNKMTYSELRSKHFFDKTGTLLQFETFKYRNPEFYFPPNKLRKMKKKRMLGILPSSEIEEKQSQNKVEVFFQKLLQKARAKKWQRKTQRKIWVRKETLENQDKKDKNEK